MKHQWKKDEKSIYLPKAVPTLITIPRYKFFTIEGSGNPNEENFSEAVGVLYSLAYGIKMLPKKEPAPPGYFEYSVYPLEGVWDLSKKGREAGVFDKNELVYKIMIRQPDFVTSELAQEVIEKIKKKKLHKLLDIVKFETIEDGTSVQMLHVGSYDNEPQSFEEMKEFCRLNNFTREDLRHREIYLSDFRRTAPEKLKTVLRYFVEGNVPK